MAVPSPDRELARLGKRLQTGLPPVTVVTGPSDFFRQRAMERLLAAVPDDAELRLVDAVDLRADGGADDDGDAPDGDATGAADGDAGEVDTGCQELLDLRGGGLFARATVVVVRRGSNWWRRHAPALAAQRERIASGSALVLEAAKLDKRRRAAADLAKALAAAGTLFEFRELYELPYDRSRGPLEGELCQWVGSAARALGVALQPEAALLVIGQVGREPGELLAELQRLKDQLGADPRRPPLAPADLRGRLTVSFESTQFEFVDAVLAGDRRAAHRSLVGMFARGLRRADGRANDTGGLLPQITNWLFKQLATLDDALALRDQGVSLDELPGRVGVRQFVDRFVEQVRRNDRAQVRRGLLALHACQRASRLTGEEPEVLLERFLGQWFDGLPVPDAEEFEL